MGRYILAVSGGVDSVAMLDLMSKVTHHEYIIAHFDHGIRETSTRDAQFVEALAKKYKFPFETRREELGSKASEELARERRYGFLNDIVKKHHADGIMTAHHLDDLVETVAINFTRGTGWRGLAVFDSPVVRPLLHMSKAELREYAEKRQLPWREDITNESDAYLRNRLRKRTHILSDEEKRQLLALHAHQLESKKAIDKEVKRLVGPGPNYSRYFFMHVPKNVALECLRYITRTKLTRPQLERALIAIKTAAHGSTYQAGAGIHLRFTTRNFSL